MTIARVPERSVAGIDDDSLDDVMAFFADGAVHGPVDGSGFHDRDAIRAAFEPRFSDAFGAMRFEVDDVHGRRRMRRDVGGTGLVAA